MSKRPLFTVSKRSGKILGKCLWQIYIPARFVGGLRPRFIYFPTRAAAEVEAKKWRDAVAGGLGDKLSSQQLTAVQRAEAVDAFAALSAAAERGVNVDGLRLADCVNFMLEHHSFCGGDLQVGALADAYYAARTPYWSEVHKNNMRGYISWVGKQFDGVRAAELTKDDLIAWFAGRFGSVVAYNAAHRVYSALFAWAVAQGEISVSPMAGIERRRERRKDSVDVLSLEEVGRLFEACADWRGKVGHPMAVADGVDKNYLLDCRDCVLPFAAQLFAGLRPVEFERLDWGDVLLEQGLVRVLPSVSKTGRLRLVPIADVLRGLFEAVPVAGRVGKLAPKNWKRKRYVCVKAAGLEGRHDVLRHSFASYHLAMWRDINLLREAMGHEYGSKMTFDHYLTAVLPSEAPKYWGWVF